MVDDFEYRGKREVMMKYFWQEEMLYNMLFLHCNESLIVFDAKGIIVDANPAARNDTLYRDRILGKNICDIYPGIFKMKLDQLEIDKKFAKEQECETVAYCESQICYPVRAKVVGLSTGGIGFAICIAENLMTQTEAMKSERAALQEIQQLNQIQNEFVAKVTHELRTPVNGISGIASNLKDSPLDDWQRQNIDMILRCCTNMGTIINDLLDFSRLEAGKFVLEYQEFELKTMLEETLEFHRKAIREKGLRLLVNIAPELPDRVIGDALRIGQIIHNLMSNAIKFTNEGYVSFEVLMTGHIKKKAELFFRVSDTGIGISRDKQDRLFKSFSQADGSITRQFGGTGLGLVISKNLLARMGGSIRVDSGAGKGSSFSFSIWLKLPEGEQGKLLSDNHGSQQLKPPADQAFFPLEIPAERIKRQRDTLEKLTICVEMGAWEKAENFAEQIKRAIPEEDTQWRRIAFRMQLEVRKENYENAISGIRTLQEHFQNDFKI